jgi:nicotinamidase-related amidase
MSNPVNDAGVQTKEVYDRAGFGAPVRRGSQPALVVVDLTRGFTEESFASGTDLTEVVRHTARLVAAAREAGLPVIFTSIQYTASEAEGHMVTWLDKSPGMRAMREGSVAVDLDPRLPQSPSDVLITKKGASAFYGTSMASVLTGLGTDTVIVCGATTSGCVRATAVDAVQSGFSVLVPYECCGDRAQAPHEANLFDIQAKYGDVISTAESIEYIESLPARPKSLDGAPSMALQEKENAS